MKTGYRRAASRLGAAFALASTAICSPAISQGISGDLSFGGILPAPSVETSTPLTFSEGALARPPSRPAGGGVEQVSGDASGDPEGLVRPPRRPESLGGASLAEASADAEASDLVDAAESEAVSAADRQDVSVSGPDTDSQLVEGPVEEAVEEAVAEVASEPEPVEPEASPRGSILDEILAQDAEQGRADAVTPSLVTPSEDLPVFGPEPFALPSAAGAPDSPIAIPVAPETVDAPADEPAAAPFVTSDVTPSSFSSLRSSALASASLDEASPDDRIELARILVGGIFIREASALVAEIKAAGVSGGILPEIEAAISALGREAPSAGQSSASVPWSSIGSSAPGRSLWDVVSSVRSGAPVSAADIRSAAASLPDHSWWIGGEVIPHLFSGALRARDADLAEMILSAAFEDGSVDDHRMSLLRGRLAEARGEDESAFDHYVAAMSSEDVTGAEARIAFADLVMARNVPETFPRLREILTEGVSAWRNDDYARRLMTRLAAVTEEIGDTLGALHVMSRISAEFPGTEEAALADSRMTVLLGSLAEKGRDGEVDVQSYMRTVRDLGWRMAPTSQWVLARTVLADKLSEFGLHEAAAAEYRSIISSVRPSDPGMRAVIEPLILKEAEMRISIGDHAGAREVLSAPFTGVSQDSLRRREVLSSQAAGLERMSAVGETPSPAEDSWLVNARNSFFSGNHSEAVRFYDAHISEGKGLPREDLSRYTMARTRAGEDVSVISFADAVGSEDGAPIAFTGETLLTESADLTRLSTQKASDVLGLASRTLEAADRILGRSAPPGEIEPSALP